MKDPANRPINYEYDSSGNLTKISRYDGTVAQYTYTYNELVGIIDGHRKISTWLDSKKRFDKLMEIDGIDGAGPAKAAIPIIQAYYENNKTVFVHKGKSDNIESSDRILEHCVFNQYGQKITDYFTDSTGGYSGGKLNNSDFSKIYSASSGNYSETQLNNLKTNNKVTAVYGGSSNVNLIPDSSFEKNSGWSNIWWASPGGTTSTFGVVSDSSAFIGGKVAKISVSSTTPIPTSCSIFRNVTVPESGTYTLSGYIKTSSVTTTDDKGAFILANFGGADYYSEYVSGSTETTADNGWRRVSVSFYASAGTTIQIHAGMRYGTTGTTSFDCLQLEKSDVANSYNMVENGGFENEMTGWTGSELNTGSGDGPSVWQVLSGSKAMRINGGFAARKCIYQEIPVNKNNGYSYVLSGWAKAASMPTDKDSRFFGMKLSVTYSDGSRKWYDDIVDQFDAFNTNWQYGAYALNIKDGSAANGALLVQKKSDRSESQKMKLLKRKSEGGYDYYTISPANSSGKVLTIKGTEQQANIELLPYSSALETQLFRFEENRSGDYNDGTYRIVPKASTGRCIDTWNAENEALQLWGNACYDSRGFAFEAVEGSGQSLKSKATYTASNQYITQMEDNDGHKTSYNYDENTDELKSVTDANGNVTKTTTGYSNGATTVIEYYDGGDLGSQGVETIYRNGMLESIDTEIVGYKFAYDGFGNQTSVKVNNITLASYVYGANNGKLNGINYGNGHKAEYTYNDMNQISKMRKYWSNAAGSGYHDANYTYDGEGNVVRKSEGFSGFSTNYIYDSIGRFVSSERSDGFKMVNRYDPYNRVIGQNYATKSLGARITYGYNNRQQVATITMGRNGTLTNTYDGLNRKTGKSIDTSKRISYYYNYNEQKSGQYVNTTRINEVSILSDGVEMIAPCALGTFEYKYDNNGNITEIWRGSNVPQYKYTYDGLNQLTSEEDSRHNKKTTYSYLKSGNIGSKVVTDTKTGTSKKIEYKYDGPTWIDRLGRYDTWDITYDAIGNPLNYRDGISMKWRYGRTLRDFNSPKAAANYDYDDEGMRTGKYVVSGGNSTIYRYYYDGGKLISMDAGEYHLMFFYDENGTPVSLTKKYEGLTEEKYYYITNIQGDVTGLTNMFGELISNYYYDAWGAPVSITSQSTGNEITSATSISILQPLRYRGYVYDNESGFYYLQSRYYDPVVGRFINADGLVSTGSGLLGFNMFSYCENNPTNKIDPTGNCSYLVACEYAVRFRYVTGDGASFEQKKSCPYYNGPDTYPTPPAPKEEPLPEVKTGMKDKDFVDAVYKRAKKDYPKTKIPPAIMTAQACYESGYGKSPVAKNKNNLFGMLGKKGARSYESVEASIISYQKNLTGLACYSSLFKLKTVEEWAYAIGPAGYCPEPGYGDGLMGVIKKWDLE